MGHLKQPENGWTEDRYAADELPSPAPHAGGVFWGAGKVREKRALMPEDASSRKHHAVVP